MSQTENLDDNLTLTDSGRSVFLPYEFRPAHKLNNDLCELVPFVWDIAFSIDQDRYHVVYDFVLPMRLMRMHDDCITMNIPLNMMREWR